jgi:hypothetical protein
MQRKAVYPRPVVHGSRGEGSRRAHTGHIDFVLRALAARMLLQRRKFLCCYAARKPIVHANRGENETLKDLRREYRTKSVPPKPDRFEADVDASFMEKDFDTTQEEWKPNIHHRRKADDLRTSFEVSERGAFGHLVTQRN